MAITDGMLNQLITYIYSTTRDGYGKITKTTVYSDVNCRWQERNELVLDTSGNEKVSRAQAWLPDTIDGDDITILTDYIVLKSGVEYQIIAVTNHYNMIGEREYIKLFLK